MERSGLKVSPSPKVEYAEWLNKRTGETEQVAVGCDPGWDTNPGKDRFKAFVPPPRGGGLPESFPSGVKPPPLPSARSADASRLMPPGLPAKDYVRAFLAEFGAGLDESVSYTDAAGQPLVVGDALFRKGANGSYKVLKRGREQNVKLLADTIKDPDEIWWGWVQMPATERWLLVRRYIARWEVEGVDKPALAVFEYSRHGWSGQTAFGPDTERYLEKQRVGMLAWRRKD